MIKGINRQMIEVTDTGSDYFERALLVVRPACSACEDERLREEARRLMQQSSGTGGMRLMRRRNRSRRLLFGAGSGLVGLFIGMLAAGCLQ